MSLVAIVLRYRLNHFHAKVIEVKHDAWLNFERWQLCVCLQFSHRKNREREKFDDTVLVRYRWYWGGSLLGASEGDSVMSTHWVQKMCDMGKDGKPLRFCIEGGFSINKHQHQWNKNIPRNIAEVDSNISTEEGSCGWAAHRERERARTALSADNDVTESVGGLENCKCVRGMEECVCWGFSISVTQYRGLWSAQLVLPWDIKFTCKLFLGGQTLSPIHLPVEKCLDTQKNERHLHHLHPINILWEIQYILNFRMTPQWKGFEREIFFSKNTFYQDRRNLIIRSIVNIMDFYRFLRLTISSWLGKFGVWDDRERESVCEREWKSSWGKFTRNTHVKFTRKLLPHESNAPLENSWKIL